MSMPKVHWLASRPKRYRRTLLGLKQRLVGKLRQKAGFSNGDVQKLLQPEKMQSALQKPQLPELPRYGLKPRPNLGMLKPTLPVPQQESRGSYEWHRPGSQEPPAANPPEEPDESESEEA